MKNTKDEIISSLKSDANKVTDFLNTLVKRVDLLENKCINLEERCAKLESENGRQMLMVAEEVKMKHNR